MASQAPRTGRAVVSAPSFPVDALFGMQGMFVLEGRRRRDCDRRPSVSAFRHILFSADHKSRQQRPVGLGHCGNAVVEIPRRTAEQGRPLGACLSNLRGRDRGGFPLNRGGADVVGSTPNEEATTMSEGKSARSLRVGWVRGVCGVARLVRGAHHGRRRAPCIRCLAQPTRRAPNAQTGSEA